MEAGKLRRLPRRRRDFLCARMGDHRYDSEKCHVVRLKIEDQYSVGSSCHRGFSLIELLMAMTITMGIGMVVFQLFYRNERVFRDQNLIVEMQQNARAVASQISEEIRMAGQGVPVYAATFDSVPSEAVTSILPTSTSSRIDFRAGLSNVEIGAVSPLPVDCALGVATALSVAAAAGFSTGDFVYIWGPADNGTWAWVRAELVGVTSNVLTIVPRQAPRDPVRFVRLPTVSLDESVSFQITGTTIKRATASGGAWSAANEIGRNFSSLTFTYYDRSNRNVAPLTAADRRSIARVDVQVVAHTSEPLSNGSRPNFSISLRTIPRNLRIR
jgi:prepilin-type N-terminal cleavage/methylation domain-containing protein